MSSPDQIPYASPRYDYERRSQDDSHIRTLVICHYVWSGLIALFSLLPLFHVGFGIAMLNGWFDEGDAPPPPFVGWMLIAFGSFAILIGEMIAVLTFYSARKMARRQWRMFSIVMAGISCLSVPLGTLLGVFTIIVLCRDSVRRQYEEASHSPEDGVRHPAWR